MSTPSDLWYKDAIFYSLNVRTFLDSNGDGIGDFRGLLQKIDYLEDLGVTAIILQPFYPSAFSDGGFDISDQRAIAPEYGDMEGFDRLLQELQQRQLRLIIDIVATHTSTRHPWFGQARSAMPSTTERDYYIWTDEASAGSSRQWAWAPEAGAYYRRSYGNDTADLNYANPAVVEALHDTIHFWAKRGVDGFRLIGLSQLFEGQADANERAVDIAREMRRRLDRHFPGRVLIGATDLWPEQAAGYFDGGDACQLNTNYALASRFFLALQTENRFPIVDTWEQAADLPEQGQWLLFLRNHDALSLVMVTDEERDYLLRTLGAEAAARRPQGVVRRLAPLLGNDRAKLELLYSLLFSLPGSPMIYYGDEIGMGDNIYLPDREGVRTPMQWTDDRNAGFSTANPQQVVLPLITDPLYRYESVNVQNQVNNTSSVWWWIKNMLAFRKTQRSLSRGRLRWLRPANGKVLAFIREHEGEQVLVVASLSRHAQTVELSLDDFAGSEPLEIFSQTRFPAIDTTTGHYTLNLGPYGYYWLLLSEAQSRLADAAEREGHTSEVRVDIPWSRFFEDYRARRTLERRILPAYIGERRWFTSKGYKMISLEIAQAPRIDAGQQIYYLLLLRLTYADSMPETYQLPVGWVTQAGQMEHYLHQEPNSVICHLETPQGEGILIDATYAQDFRDELFWRMSQDDTLSLPNGRLKFESGKLLQDADIPRKRVDGQLLNANSSNTPIIYNDAYFFKLFRKLDTDINPDLELVRFLSERSHFRNCPRYGGGVESVDNTSGSFAVIGLLQNKIDNQGDAWSLMMDTLAAYYSRVLKQRATAPPELQRADSWEAVPEPSRSLIGREAYQQAALLGRRTAEMHIALVSDDQDPDFAPEPFTRHYQRSLYSGYRKLMSEKLGTLEQRLGQLPAAAAAEARQVLGRREEIEASFRDIYRQPIQAVKTRVHGDYHLGQVLWNGEDFFIIDFEGEPLLSISERRLKRTPFKDVAGMMRSFHYAAYGQLMLSSNYRQEDLPVLESWARQWYHYMSQAFLQTYLQTVAGQPFLPPSNEEVNRLLRAYTLEKAIYEVAYELNSRPDWLRIPLRGVLNALDLR